MLCVVTIYGRVERDRDNQLLHAKKNWLLGYFIATVAHELYGAILFRKKVYDNMKK